MPSEEQILEYLDQLRENGLRPSLICVMVVNRRIGMFASNDYPGWEFLQGGIDFNELPQDTLEREVIEELGFHFHQDCKFPVKQFVWLFEDDLKTKIKGTLKTRSGKEVKPIAKHYIVFMAELNTEIFPEINKDDFAYTGTTVKLHRSKWVGSKEALELVKTIQNPKKKEVASRAIELATNKGFCD